MIALQKIPIIEWDDLGPEADGHIIRVPYADIDEITTELRNLEREEGAMPHLLAPYKGDDPSFNARAASVLWDRLPDFSVFMAVATSNRIAMQDFVKAALKSGFKKLAVPYRYGYNHQYRFDQLMQFLHGIYDDTVWFHVAGGAPEIPDGWSGKWSWSEEEL